MHKQALSKKVSVQARVYALLPYLEQHAVETPWPNEQGS